MRVSLMTVRWLRGALGLALAAPTALAAQVAAAPAVPHAAAIDSARAVARAFMEEKGIVGLSVAVGVRGETVWSEGFGYADLENRSPVRTTTRFRVGSLSKSLTAAAVGLLVERGQLELDAPVRRYVPAFPRKEWPVTTRQLAGHVAGVRHYRGDEFLSNVRYQSVQDGLRIFANDPLLFEPGTRYSYSSYGWNLVSAVVEGASGESFLVFMRRHVFDPLGMRHTAPDVTDSIIPERTRFYGRTEDGRIVNAPYVDNSYKWAGGGFLSTPEDLLRFAFAHLRPGFLQPETVTLLWTSQRLLDGEPTGYGIGWRVGVDASERRVVSHSGGSVGGRSLLLIFPEQQVVLAIAANVTDLQYGDVPRRIVQFFMP